MLAGFSRPFSVISHNQMWKGRREGRGKEGRQKERNAGEREIVVGEERRTNPALCLSAVLDFLSDSFPERFHFLPQRK